jgi:hypothetical protein
MTQIGKITVAPPHGARRIEPKLLLLPIAANGLWKVRGRSRQDSVIAGVASVPNACGTSTDLAGRSI